MWEKIQMFMSEPFFKVLIWKTCKNKANDIMDCSIYNMCKSHVNIKIIDKFL